MTNNTTFATRLQEARNNALNSASDNRLKSDVAINDALKRESIAILTTAINQLADELHLDSERLANRIKLARKSPYGRITEMITMIASIYAWPVYGTASVTEIPELQERALDTLAQLGINVDGDLLLDIKEAKGHTSFLDTTTFEVVEALEPEYEELEYYLLTFAEAAKLPIIDYKMNEVTFNKLETKALASIEAEKVAAEEALKRHNEMLNTKEVA